MARLTCKPRKLTLTGMVNLGLEIDFLQVGDGERSGDAIALRYGNLLGGQEVMIIDGGNKESGAALVDHVANVYGTGTVQHVVNTHPDGDHSSGLTEVLERLDVKNLWMHRPWNYTGGLLSRFRDPRFTKGGLEARIRDALDAAHNLEEIATAKRIPISEPYTGNWIGPFLVLSPDAGWYLNDLVPNFARTPEAKQQPTGILSPLFTAATDAVEFVAETLNFETLDESGETSAQNESSVVLYGAETSQSCRQRLHHAHSARAREGARITNAIFIVRAPPISLDWRGAATYGCAPANSTAPGLGQLPKS